MYNNPIESWALYSINKACVIWMKSCPADQELSYSVSRESPSGDIYSGSPMELCLVLKYSVFSFMMI